ncbi:MAG: ATP-binding protein [Lachnospiraceae bacterium]|nr:ATP-binding protein [Lachnospiraceae bacterium]
MKKKKYQRINSLKIRLICLIMLLGVLSGLIVRMGVMIVYEKEAVSAESIEILSYAKVLANDMAAANYLEHPDLESITSQLKLMSRIYDGRIMVIDETFRIIEDTYQMDEGKTIISEEVVRSYSGEEIINYDDEYHYIELSIPLKAYENAEEGDQVIGMMMVSVSTDDIENMLTYIKKTSLILVLVWTACLVAVSVFAAIRITLPFERIARDISDLQNGFTDDRDEALAVNNYTETAKISEQFNRLYSRMRLLDQSRQDFVSNVSHELKTPLTSMKVLADSLNGQEDVPIELYRDFMQDIGIEIERENKIINDLLSLVKMDRSAADLNIAVININEMLDLILKRLRPIAEQQHIELVLESFRPVSAEIDEVKLTLAITNLIENAIKYNKENGWVHVSLNADHQYFYLKVEDSGIGIPEEEQEHIYERFYRVDKSHSREIGGTGLGLAITRNAIVMHRGAIKVFSVEGEGTTFTVRIPLNYIE